MKKENNFKRFFVLRVTTAVILFIFLIYTVGIKKLLSTFTSVALFPGLLVPLCLFLLYLLGALNIWLLLKNTYEIKFSPFLKNYSYSWIASLLTPGQAGDASLIIFLRNKGVPMKHTGVAYIIDKCITLSLFLWIALVGSYSLFPKLQIYFIAMAVALVIAFCTVLVFFHFPPTHYLPASKFTRRFTSTIEDIKLLRPNLKLLLINLFITILKWLIVSLAFYLSFFSFGVTVSFVEIATIPIISTLVGYIPISIAGIGTVELIAGYLFMELGFEQPIVLSSYLFVRSLQYLLALFLLGIISLFRDNGQ